MNSFFIRRQSAIVGAIIGIGISIYTFVPEFERLKRETNGTFILSKDTGDSNVTSNKEPVSVKESTSS